MVAEFVVLRGANIVGNIIPADKRRNYRGRSRVTRPVHYKQIRCHMHVSVLNKQRYILNRFTYNDMPISRAHTTIEWYRCETHTRTRARTDVHTCTHTHTHARTLTHTHAHTLTHSHTHTLTQSHTHTLTRSLHTPMILFHTNIHF